MLIENEINTFSSRVLGRNVDTRLGKRRCNI